MQGCRVPIYTGTVFITMDIEMVCNTLRTVSLFISKLKDHPNNLCLCITDCEIMYLMLPLIHSSGVYQHVSIGADAACKMALFSQDMQAVSCSHRGFLAFTISLPIADIVH